MILPLPSIIIESRVQGLCKLPYPGHLHGCPNFGRKLGCPPGCPRFDARFDGPYFAIVNEFDLAAHVARLRRQHPDWTARQLECCLYWQPTARAQQRLLIQEFLCRHHRYQADACPEAGGVNVTATLVAIGVTLEWPPKRIVRQVAIAGVSRGCRGDSAPVTAHGEDWLGTPVGERARNYSMGNEAGEVTADQ